MSGQYASGGVRLRYQDTGQGAPVLFLHPTPLDHDYWRPMTAELSGIRAIAPDFRGHGRSELGSDLPTGLFDRVPDASVLTMTQLARDVIALLDSLSLRSVVVAGCSIGGYVLLELWRQAPHRIRGLALICSKPQADAEAALVKRAENIARVRSEGAEGFFDTMAQTLVGATTRREHPAIVAEVRGRMALTPQAVAAVQAGLAVRPDSVPTVSTIRMPVFALAGAEDASISVADMEAFKAAPGGCRFHVLPNAGHLAAYEQPQQVAELFNRWLHDAALL